MKCAKVKLADVAKLAQVSTSAAGKVLNGGSEAIRVSPATQKRILAAAQTLNYQRNVAASILAGGSSQIIGVMCDTIMYYRSLKVIQEIEVLCNQRGYRLMTNFSHNSIEGMINNYQSMQRYNVAGVICCSHDYPMLNNSFVENLTERDNIIFLETPGRPELSCVETSRQLALTKAISFYLTQQKRKIMLCVGSKWQSEIKLLGEFKAAMAQNKLPINDENIACYPDDCKGLEKRIQWVIEHKIIPHHPDVIYIDDEQHGAVLQAKLKEAQIATTLLGGNGHPMFAALGIASLDPGYEKIAQALVDAIFASSYSRKKQNNAVIEASFN